MHAIPWSRSLTLASVALSLGACAHSLEVKPIDLSADPAAQVKSLKDAVDTARQDEVNLFAPTWFARADASATAAANLRAEGGEIGSILKAVARGKAELGQARRFADIGRKELAEPYQARKDAIAAGAPELYGDDFSSAERRFRGLGESIEGENLSGARKAGKDVVQAYNALEQRAIKQHTLGEARRLIDVATRNDAKRYAPRTLKEAEQSLSATDQFITANPKASREIQAKAEETLRQANHLQVVLQQVKSWERIGIEEHVRQVESGLGKIEAAMAKGEEAKPVRTLDQRFVDTEQRARVLVDNQAFLGAELGRVLQQRREEQAEALKRETAYQAQLAKTTAEEQRVASQLKAEKDTAARFERVRQMFGREEAEVYRQGNDALIRLKGLNFEVGKSYLLPEHYPLLTKVMQATRILDASKMLVEGHTDTTGSAVVNLVLSRERADAVKAYIVNNGGLAADLITAIGFGPDKPIAANTSPEGRRVNRRIDVILRTR